VSTIAPQQTISARLAKDGLRVLCGKVGPTGTPDCGQMLTYLQPGNPQQGRLTIHFGAGWREGADGIVALTPRAKKELGRDRWRASANPGTEQRRADDAKERLASGASVHFRRVSRYAQYARRMGINYLPRRNEADVERHLLKQVGIAPSEIVRRIASNQLSNPVMLPCVARCPRCCLLNRIENSHFFASPHIGSATAS